MYHKTLIISSEPPNWLEWPLVLPNVQVWTRHGDTFQFGDHLPIHNQTELVTDIAINKSMLNPKFHWIIAMMFDSCPLRQQQYRIRRLHRFVPLCISTGLWPSVHNYYALAALQRYGKRQGPVCLVIDNQVWWVMLILWVQEVSTDKSRQSWSAFTPQDIKGGISLGHRSAFANRRLESLPRSKEILPIHLSGSVNPRTAWTGVCIWNLAISSSLCPAPVAIETLVSKLTIRTLTVERKTVRTSTCHLTITIHEFVKLWGKRQCQWSNQVGCKVAWLLETWFSLPHGGFT